MTNGPMNTKMRDGSRKFAELPQTVLWEELRDHIATLNGATITGFITDQVTEGWIDFTYCSYQFAVNDQFGQYWFFVADPVCPEEILRRVISHSALILAKTDGIAV